MPALLPPRPSPRCLDDCGHGVCSGPPDFICVCDLGWTSDLPPPTPAPGPPPPRCSRDCGCNFHSHCHRRGPGFCEECQGKYHPHYPYVPLSAPSLGFRDPHYSGNLSCQGPPTTPVYIVWALPPSFEGEGWGAPQAGAAPHPMFCLLGSTDWTWGEHCEQCRPGSFGNATSSSGCRPCQCNGHGDPRRGHCDSISGLCFCQDHTEGAHCQLCSPGYYGDPR